jgi:hypothetical protein
MDRSLNTLAISAKATAPADEVEYDHHPRGETTPPNRRDLVILVTGPTGKVGSNVVRELLEILNAVLSAATR